MNPWSLEAIEAALGLVYLAPRRCALHLGSIVTRSKAKENA